MGSMLAGEEKDTWEGEDEGKDQVLGRRRGFVISPDVDSPAVTGTALDVTEQGDQLV